MSNNSYFGGIAAGLKTLATGMKVTMKEYFTPKSTEQYPENRKTTLHISPRFRGRLVFVRDENEAYKCVGCTLCEKSCPNDTIKIQTEMVEDPETGKKKRKLVDYQYDLGDCMFCELCVNGIVEMAAAIQKLVPDVEVAFAHGQMSERELEKVMYRFINGEIDVLVSTTIIETGLDISNVNTMIIHDADKLGLSQLYQLRGRVGRSNRTAYAFLLYQRNTVLREVAEKRLAAIREFTEFGSGFKIAMRDLEIRGAGDLLGARQHGHMESIGYDLYIKILNEAVLEEKGEKPKERADCTVNIGRDSYIPESYIEDPAQRIDVYKKIATVETEQDMDDIAAELLDRYGDLPPSVETLLSISLLRALAIDCAFVQIDQTEDGAVIYPRYLDIAAWSEMIALYPKKSITVIASAKPSVRCKNKSGEPILPFICGLLKKYIQIKSKKE